MAETAQVREEEPAGDERPVPVAPVGRADELRAAGRRQVAEPLGLAGGGELELGSEENGDGHRHGAASAHDTM